MKGHTQRQLQHQTTYWNHFLKSFFLADFRQQTPTPKKNLKNCGIIFIRLYEKLSLHFTTHTKLALWLEQDCNGRLSLGKEFVSLERVAADKGKKEKLKWSANSQRILKKMAFSKQEIRLGILVLAWYTCSAMQNIWSKRYVHDV